MSNDSKRRILGIDPGLNVTGYAVIDAAERGPIVCEAGVIRGRDRMSLTSRLDDIHRGLSEVIEQWQPGVMSLEQLYSHYQRPRTAILMGHARGVICLAAVQAKIEVHHYSATNVKKTITGNGRASKRQIQLAMAREFGLREAPEPADVADALAIALVHFHQEKRYRAAAMAGQAAAPAPKLRSARGSSVEHGEVPEA